jgi:hypothetical protein
VVLLLPISDIRGNERHADRSAKMSVTAYRLKRLLVEIDKGVRQFVLTRDAAQLGSWRSARAELPRALASLMSQVRSEHGGAQQTPQIVREQSAFVDASCRGNRAAGLAAHVNDEVTTLEESLRRGGARRTRRDHDGARDDSGRRRDRLAVRTRARGRADRQRPKQQSARADRAGRHVELTTRDVDRLLCSERSDVIPASW